MLYWNYNNIQSVFIREREIRVIELSPRHDTRTPDINTL